MPQATDELRALFPGGDEQAWNILKLNFTETKGIIKSKEAGYIPTKRECEAIDYLCDEWDYGFALNNIN